jgi:predicted Zn-dependent protease with MMP-like domain
MEKEEFELLVVQAIDSLPEEFRSQLENVAIVVNDWPTKYQLTKAGIGRGQMLLGLYEGVPLTRRGVRYNMVQPDKITIFQKSIEIKCKDNDLIVQEIQRVVWHEIAHHFGIGETKLRQIEKNRHRKTKNPGD